MRIKTFLLQLNGSTENGACLHLCNLRIGVAQTATTVSEHGVSLRKAVDTLLNLLYRYAHLVCHGLLTCKIVGNELV